MFGVKFPTEVNVRGEFAACRRGNVTMLFGLSVTILMGATGSAIDFARFHQGKAKAQTALDAATLAGGRAVQLSSDITSPEPITHATTYYDRMRPMTGSSASPTFSVIENGTAFRGTVTFSMSSYFLSVIGIPTITANLVSETAIAAGGNAGTNLELSLMLDTTGSMEGQKIEDLKLAAKDLVDIVVWNDQSAYTSKIALAPFSSRVNVGSYLKEVTDVLDKRKFSGVDLKGITCVTDRTGDEALTDAKPIGANTLSAFRGDKGNAAKDNPDNYSETGECSVPEIMPLTSDKAALKDRIDTLPAKGSTAGALGTAWAWYLLSPNWDGIWKGEAKPAPYSDLTLKGPKGQPKLLKVAVLMTDGIYNTAGGQNFGDTSSEATTISERAASICANMKAAGVKIYTIGFQLGDNELAKNTLKACASREATDPTDSPSYFYSAESGSELRGAFRQIALQLSTLRLRM